MKIINKIILILISTLVLFSCEPQVLQPDATFELSFKKQGLTSVLAGSTFYVKSTGNGEFITLYDGNKYAEWNVPGSKGVNFNGLDSLPITYDKPGKYIVAVVASRATDSGIGLLRDVDTMSVVVVDIRNEITSFSIKDINNNVIPATISSDSTVTVSLPDNNIELKFAAKFTLSSLYSRAEVNGVVQKSDTTINDFKNNLTYSIIAPNGNTRNYKVKFVTFPASPLKQLHSFQLGLKSVGEIAEIDEVNKKITMSLNFATNKVGPTIIATSSKLTKISIASSSVLYNGPLSPTANYDLSKITAVKVTAQNGDVATYTFVLSQQLPIVSFGFIGLYPAPEVIINPTSNPKTVTINAFKGTDVTKLVAKWTGSLGVVKIGTDIQTNGVTVNDFTTPKTYSFYKLPSGSDSYIITVNVVN